MKRLLVVLVGVPIILLAQATRAHAYIPANGFVPDSATAVRIAVAIWTPIYGEDRIAAEQPCHAQLRGGIWTVTVSLPFYRWQLTAAKPIPGYPANCATLATTCSSVG